MCSRRFHLRSMLGRCRGIILSSAKVISWSKGASLLVGLTITWCNYSLPPYSSTINQEFQRFCRGGSERLLTWLVTVPAPVQGQKLRVGVAGSAPFVLKDGDKFQGISLDIWKEIARSLGFDYELIPQPRVQSGLEAVANGQLDVLIGPISITPKRLKRMNIEFSQPMFYVQIGLVLPSQPSTLWSRVKPFFGIAAISSLLGLCLLLFVVGNLIWLVERQENSQQFPPQYLSGVGNGIWLSGCNRSLPPRQNR